LGARLDRALSVLSADRLSSHVWKLDAAKLLRRFVEETDLRGFLNIYFRKIII
jgi:hypothetical protein